LQGVGRAHRAFSKSGSRLSKVELCEYALRKQGHSIHSIFDLLQRLGDSAIGESGARLPNATAALEIVGDSSSIKRTIHRTSGSGLIVVPIVDERRRALPALGRAGNASSRE